MSAFSKLSLTQLEALGAALDSDRITSGDHLGLQQYVPADLCREIGSEIETLLAAGVPIRQVAYFLRSLAKERSANGDVSSVELVWTGPEGVQSSSRDTGVVVRELFRSATKSILIAGFAVHRGREIFRQLADRMTEKADLEVRMFLNIPRALRDTTLTEHLVARFARDFRRDHWDGVRVPEVFYDPRSLVMDERKRTSLHAKCVVVDGATSFVTSANFTEAAQQRNIEVGALIRDSRFSRNLIQQFDTLIESGALVQLALG